VPHLAATGLGQPRCPVDNIRGGDGANHLEEGVVTTSVKVHEHSHRDHHNVATSARHLDAATRCLSTATCGEYYISCHHAILALHGHHTADVLPEMQHGAPCARWQ
jgi:hypothetical protein